MLKNLKSKLNNSGNTFIVIMVSIACMSILVAVIIASVGYYFRAGQVSRNNKNNFYYLEKAMDEIYSGVGNDTIEHLMSAYSDTMEVLVRYDAVKKEYVRIDEAEANEIMKQKFLSEIANDASYKNQEELKTHIASFLSEETKNANVELVTTTDLDKPRMYLEIVTKTVTNNGVSTEVYDKIIIHNITVSRTVEGDSNGNKNGYMQTITTDITISEPGFGVSFSDADELSSPIYDFSMIADRGIEFDFNGAPIDDKKEVSINGNVYAASDFYNKDYSSLANGTGALANPCDGRSNDQTLYSGLYTDGGTVSIRADKVIVPGTIAVMNDSTLRLSGRTDSLLNIGESSLTTQLADVWTDNIVLAPSTVRTSGLNTDNGTLSMYANVYVADDLEINSDNANITLTGNYYGYNYSQNIENQTDDYYSKLSEYANGTAFGGNKAHFNSSAILINGNGANLDFTHVAQLHVAGRAYIETSREKKVEADTENNSSTTTYIPAKDSEGNVYRDIQTGESISIKSNQLAYFASSVYTEEEVGAGSSMLGFPKFTGRLEKDALIKEDIRFWLDQNNPVVTCTIAGQDYNFLQFRDARASKDFFNWYANEMPNDEDYSGTNIVNVKTYDNFLLNNISVDSTSELYKTVITTSGTYTTGSLGIDGETLTVTDGNMFNTAITNFANIANARNADYKELRYGLVTIDSELYSDETIKAQKEAEEAAIADLRYASITPINQYLEFNDITSNKYYSDIASYKVWISNDDVHVGAECANASGVVTGMIIAKGDVTFDSSIKKFEGLIVTGSKIKVDHAMEFSANKVVVRTILTTAEQNSEYEYICKLFKDYVESSVNNTTEGVPVGKIEVGDVLLYENWKKNAE